ncbi:hypothetical protein ABID56_001219 [Alkalibacillus flavidus]|uniref:Type 4 fimbrial biogenesis protein PilX N-terminal domain-containing protein n=1 Tax=Alkalibacillus flavidus TaxID=546021 RepID=A0ABV2KU67_9BACI
MRYIQEERGAILVVVLLTIVFMMFFATVMMNSVLTTAKQNNVIEENYRATHVAEMGAIFVEDQIQQYVEQNDLSTDSSSLNDLETYLNQQIANVTIDEDQPEVEYFIEEGFTVTSDGDSQMLSLKVNGQDENANQIITLTFALSSGSGADSLESWNEESNTVPNRPENPDETYPRPVDLKKKNCIQNSQTVVLESGGNIKCSPSFNELYVNDDLSFGNNDTLTVEQNAKFESLDMTGLSKVLIKGHAHFEGELTSGNNPNSNFIACGNVRLKGGADYQGGYQVNHYTVADELFYNKQGPVIFGDDTLLKSGLSLDNTSATANGDLTIQHDGTQSASTYLNTIGGNIKMAGGTLTIENANGDQVTQPNSNNVNYDVQPASIPDCEGVEPPTSGGGQGDSNTSVSLDDIDY